MFSSTAKDSKTNAARDGMINEGGRTTIEDIQDAAHHLKADARDAASAIKNDLGSMAHQTGVHVRELVDTAGNGFSDIRGAMSRQIREKPIQSSVIALGVGVVFGFLFSRR